MAIPQVTVGLVEGALGLPPSQTDNVVVVLGHCSVGTVNTLYNFSNSTPTAIVAALGYGKLTQCLCQIVSTPGHGPVIGIPLTAATAGAASAVVAAGTSPPTVTVTGACFEDGEVIVKIMTGGTRGTATFKFSRDNGTTYSAELATAATYLMPNTNTTLNFATGTYVSDNVYTFTMVAPIPSTTNVASGFAALIAAGTDFGWAHVAVAVGGTLDTDRATAMASMFSTLSTQASSLETAYKFIGISMETPSPVDPTTSGGLTAWRAALASAAPALSDKRVNIVAGYGRMTSDVDSLSYRRPIGWGFAARMSVIPVGEHPGKVLRGSMRTYTSIEHDEETTGGLDTYRYTTARTIAGRAGFWITRGKQMAAVGSDYGSTQNLRVINTASKAGRNALLSYLNSDLVLDAKTGYLRSDEADAIDIDLSSQLKSALGTNASSSAARVGRVDDILRLSTITGEFTVLPLGYAEAITFTLGFARNIATP